MKVKYSIEYSSYHGLPMLCLLSTLIHRQALYPMYLELSDEVWPFRKPIDRVIEVRFNIKCLLDCGLHTRVEGSLRVNTHVITAVRQTFV